MAGRRREATELRRRDVRPSLPGLTRQPVLFTKCLLRRWMDARVKPAHDDCHCRCPVARHLPSSCRCGASHPATSLFKQPRLHDLAADAPEPCKTTCLENEGVGNAGCATHPQPRVQNKTKHTSVVTTGTAEITRHSRTQWFYGLFRALPGDEFVLSPSSADMACLSPVGPTCLREFNTSNGCQNHTALPYANSAVRQRAVNRSRDPALRSRHTPDAAASTASRPASVTIAIRPCKGARRRWI